MTKTIPLKTIIIYYTIICNVINLLYGLSYVKAISHIALYWQIFVFYFVHFFCFILFFFSFLFWLHFYVRKRMNFYSCPYGNPSSQKLFREKRNYSSKFRELCYRGEGKSREKREERQIGRNLWEKKRQTE